MPDALTVDAAVAQLNAAEAPPEDQEAAPEALAAEPAAEVAEPEAEAAEGEETEAADPAAEDEAGAEEPTGEEEAEPVEPAQPAIAAPRSWDAERQAEFNKLPRALQQYVAERETAREQAVNTALQDASEARKVTEATNAKVEKLAGELNTFLPQAIKTFGDKWGNPDWAAVARERGADEAFALKAEYDQERAQLGELARKQAETQALAHQAFVERETQRLAEISPELSHPESGAKLRQDVAQWAVNQGAVTLADLPNVTASQLTIAHKAMQWDAIPADVKAALLVGDAAKLLKTIQPAPKLAAQRPAAPAARPGVRPSAAVNQASSQTRTAQTAANRFAQTRSVDDAVALLETRRR